MTPKQLELCRLIGLLEEPVPGVVALTRLGRALVAEGAPAPKLETHDEWIARVATMRRPRGSSSGGTRGKT